MPARASSWCLRLVAGPQENRTLPNPEFNYEELPKEIRDDFLALSGWLNEQETKFCGELVSLAYALPRRKVGYFLAKVKEALDDPDWDGRFTPLVTVLSNLAVISDSRAAGTGPIFKPR